MKRGEIYYADLDPTVGSEQGGIRPILILQNAMGNKHSPTTIVATITSKIKQQIPTHVYIGTVGTLINESYVLLEQIRTIDKKRITKYVGTLSPHQMELINKALKISIDIA